MAKRRQRAGLSPLWFTVLTFFLSVSVFTTGYLVWGKLQLKQEVAALTDMAKEMVTTIPVEVIPAKTVDVSPLVVEEVKTDDALTRRIDFAELKGINPDTFSWVYQPGTNIDFYVMHEDYKNILNPFYIWRDIYKQKNRTGSALTFTYPYSDDAIRIVYAHHFITEEPVMFTEHTKFKDQGFAEAHPYFYMYYEDRVERYRIWAPVNATHAHDVYYMPYAKGSPDYAALIDKLESEAFFTLGEKPSASSNLLILSSCDRLYGSWSSGGRMMLVGVPDVAYYYDGTVVQAKGPDYTFERSVVTNEPETSEPTEAITPDGNGQ